MNDQDLPPVLIPPIQTGPPPETEPRNRVGWYVLGALLLLMCWNSVATSLQPGSTKGKAVAQLTAKTSPYEVLVQQETSMRTIANKLELMGAGTEQAQTIRQDAADSLTETISDLVDKSKSDPEASRWYAVMRTEQGKPVPPENIEILQKSKSDRDQAIAAVYSAKKLSKEEATALAKRIGEATFYEKLVKVQALEKAGDRTIRGLTFGWKKAVGQAVVVAVVFGIFTVGGILWMIYLRARSKGAAAPLGHPLSSLTLAEADRLAQRAAEILLIFCILSFLVPAFVKGSAAIFAEGIGILVALALLAKVPIRGKLISLSDVGLNTKNLGNNILWGIGGFLAEFPLMAILAFLGSIIFSFLPAPSHPVDEQLMNAKSLLQIAPILIFGSITAPIWEEFVFRGLIFPGLARVTRRVPLSAVMTGFIFAMIHPQGIVLWMALATVGTMGCALTMQRRSLVPSIVMHMLHNTTIFALFLLATGKF